MIKRLTKDDNESWGLFPLFLERVKLFATKYDIKCPIDPILFEMQQRWVQTPNLAGYFVGYKGNHIYSHCACWITTSYGVNKLYIYQAEADANEDGFQRFVPLLVDWLKDLNTELKPEFHVKNVEFCTWHDPEVWMRYFRLAGLESATLRHVIGISLGHLL